MTVPALFGSPPYRQAIRARWYQLCQGGAHLAAPLLRRLDQTTPNQRKVVATIGSVLLHLALLLLLMPSRSGLDTSMGTVTGLGEVKGAGTAVTLVNVSEFLPPKASAPAAEAPSTGPVADAVAPSETIALTDDASRPDEAKEATAEPEKTSLAQSTPSDSELTANSLAQATAGAFGHNGETNIDLWNAIAPCWNRIATNATLPATLKISFDEKGQLSVPPEIERDPDAPITDQSLKSEAQALQALSECGAYPMAQGQQNVVVQFPTPGLVPSAVSGNQTKIAAVQP